MKTAQIISWLRDKAARAGDHSHRRMLAAAADRLAHYVAAENAAGPEDQSQEAEYCLVCLRWSECNGVDDGCPLRKEDDTDGKSGQGCDSHCG